MTDSSETFARRTPSTPATGNGAAGSSTVDLRLRLLASSDRLLRLEQLISRAVPSSSSSSPETALSPGAIDSAVEMLFEVKRDMEAALKALIPSLLDAPLPPSPTSSSSNETSRDSEQLNLRRIK